MSLRANANERGNPQKLGLDCFGVITPRNDGTILSSSVGMNLLRFDLLQSRNALLVRWVLGVDFF